MAEPPIEYVRSVSAAAVALCVTVNCPSVAGSAAGLVVAAMLTSAVSSSVIVPIPVSVSVTSGSVVLRLTVKVSLPSNIASSKVATVNCWVSPAFPAKLRTATTLS